MASCYDSTGFKGRAHPLAVSPDFFHPPFTPRSQAFIDTASNV